MRFILSLLLLTASAHAADLLVAAAADLSSLQIPLQQAFQRLTGQRVRITLGSSGNLAHQIENGAPYDVFLSANEGYVNELDAAGKLEPGTARVYALGRIALWSKSGAFRTMDALTQPSILHIAIANPKFAPYGVAAEQALRKQGLLPKLQPKLVYGENVRQALQFAESGNADVAIVAYSLVYNRGGILLPADWHAPIRQSCAVIKGSAQTALARQFIEFLSSPAGSKLLESHGLTSTGSAPTH